MTSKKTKFDPSVLLLIDHRSMGGDFLPLFQQNYPEYPCLHTPDFEELIDQLALESVDNCAEALAAWLQPHKYTLWNADSGGDDYHLAIVPKSKVKEFVRFWSEGNEGDQEDGGADFRLPLEEIRPPEKIQKPTKKSSKKFIWAEAVFQHDTYGGVGSWISENRPRVFMEFRDYDEENDKWEICHELMDLATWPPQPIEISSGCDEKFTRQWLPVQTATEPSLWMREKDANKNTHHFYVGSIDSFSTWNFKPWWSPKQKQEGWHSLPQRFGAGMILVTRVFDKKSQEYSAMDVLVVTPARAEPWFCDREPRNLHVYPSPNQSECLIIKDSPQDDRRYVLAQGPVTVENFMPFPVTPADHGVFFLDEDEIIFFSEFERAGNPTRGGHVMQEKVLQMNRFHLRTKVHQFCVLEDFCSDSVHNFKLFKSDPDDKVRIRSFEGFVDVRKGHEDWWVLNHISRSPGARDLAWMWNARTSQVIRIGTAMFPRLEPRILYLPALGRYVADESCNLMLLKDFSELDAQLPKSFLQWRATA
jgi:hypothetical protein